MIPCCYPSLRKCCYTTASEGGGVGGADLRNPSRRMASSSGGAEAVAVVDLCFGSLGRFAMEGGKVMLGCEADAERAHWEEEEEEELKELPTSPQSTLSYHGSSYAWDSSLISPSSSSSSSASSSARGGGSGGALSSGVSSPPTPPVAAPGGSAGAAGATAYPRELGSDDALDALCVELLRLKTEGEARERAQRLQQQLLLLRHQKHYHHLLTKMRAAATEDMEPPKPHAANQGILHRKQQSRGTGYWGQATKPGRSSSAIARSSFQFSENTASSTIAHGAGAAPPSPASHHSQNMASVPTTNGSGMRAVFLSGGGGRNPRESSGTGVFLPRRPDTKSRKPVCSTVLLPSRIVHALNLNLEEALPSPSMAAPRDQSITGEGAFWIGRTSSSSSSAFSVPPLDRIHYNHMEASMQALQPSLSSSSSSIGSIASQRVDNITLQEVAPDISLPTEWIY